MFMQGTAQTARASLPLYHQIWQLVPPSGPPRSPFLSSNSRRVFFLRRKPGRVGMYIHVRVGVVYMYCLKEMDTLMDGTLNVAALLQRLMARIITLTIRIVFLLFSRVSATHVCDPASLYRPRVVGSNLTVFHHQHNTKQYDIPGNGQRLPLIL